MVTMTNFSIIVLFLIILASIISVIFCVEGREIKKVKHASWLTKVGLKESAYLIHSDLSSWTNFCG